MRPRHKAAENVRGPKVMGTSPGDASMRPRHKAAENRRSSAAALGPHVRFNEAAA